MNKRSNKGYEPSKGMRGLNSSKTVVPPTVHLYYYVSFLKYNRLSMIVRVNVVLNRTVVVDSD